MKGFALHRSRPRYCGEPVNGNERCQEPPAPGYNPLDFCGDHLALYRERVRTGIVSDKVRIAPGQATPMGEHAATLALDFT